MATVICDGCGWKLAITSVPDVCPKCDGHFWRAQDDPVPRYRLSENDRRFLRALHISPAEG